MASQGLSCTCAAPVVSGPRIPKAETQSLKFPLSLKLEAELGIVPWSHGQGPLIICILCFLCALLTSNAMIKKKQKPPALGHGRILAGFV